MPTERNWFEQELLEALAEDITNGSIELLYEMTPFIQRLVASFPVPDIRIDWGAVPNAQMLPAPPGRATSSFRLVEPATELRVVPGTPAPRARNR